MSAQEPQAAGQPAVTWRTVAEQALRNVWADPDPRNAEAEQNGKAYNKLSAGIRRSLGGIIGGVHDEAEYSTLCEAEYDLIAIVEERVVRFGAAILEARAAHGRSPREYPEAEAAASVARLSEEAAR